MLTARTGGGGGGAAALVGTRLGPPAGQRLSARSPLGGGDGCAEVPGRQVWAAVRRCVSNNAGCVPAGPLTVGDELVEALGDLACHDVRPPLLVAAAGEQGQEDILRHRRQRLQRRLAQLAVHNLHVGLREEAQSRLMGGQVRGALGCEAADV